MSNWISIDATSLKTDRHESVRGVGIVLGISPFEIPEAVRGYYDEGRHRFVIEFQYLDDDPDDDFEEAIHESRPSAQVSLGTGAESGRLREVLVDIDSLKADAVQLRILVAEKVSEELRHLADENSSKRRHYELAGTVLHEKADELIPAGAM